MPLLNMAHGDLCACVRACAYVYVCVCVYSWNDRTIHCWMRDTGHPRKSYDFTFYRYLKDICRLWAWESTGNKFK